MDSYWGPASVVASSPGLARANQRPGMASNIRQGWVVQTSKGDGRPGGLVPAASKGLGRGGGGARLRQIAWGETQRNRGHVGIAPAERGLSGWCGRGLGAGVGGSLRLSGRCGRGLPAELGGEQGSA
eukprot:3623894-Rhodomonas_salina.1